VLIDCNKRHNTQDELTKQPKIPQEHATKVDAVREGQAFRSCCSCPSPVQRLSEEVRPCHPASLSHTFQNTRLTVLTDLRISLLEALSKFEKLTLILSIIRMCWVGFDIVLCERRGVETLVLLTCCTEPRGVGIWGGRWRIGSCYCVSHVDRCCRLSIELRIGDFAILRKFSITSSF